MNQIELVQIKTVMHVMKSTPDDISGIQPDIEINEQKQ